MRVLLFFSNMTKSRFDTSFEIPQFAVKVSRKQARLPALSFSMLYSCSSQKVIQLNLNEDDGRSKRIYKFQLANSFFPNKFTILSWNLPSCMQQFHIHLATIRLQSKCEYHGSIWVDSDPSGNCATQCMNRPYESFHTFVWARLLRETFQFSRLLELLLFLDHPKQFLVQPPPF